MRDNYLVTIGLETHVQLNTRTKIWCGCPNAYGREPNTDICPVCAGYPGALPVLNREAVRRTVMTGLMLGCKINLYSKHDRKSYFYPDMPKNYQISQYDAPLCLDGEVPIAVAGSAARTVRLTRIHLEEDVAKSTHYASSSVIDFNRAGTPLMEIVTEPDIHSADEAYAYLAALKQILQYGGVSDCNLEEGNIRCDVNCSVAPAGHDELGVKTEIKNMNTFRGVHRALQYEIQRQIKVLEDGGTIPQETRRWDDDAGVTHAMRSKEYAHDYRYFPDPDLMPIVLTEDQVRVWREELPELPAARRARFQRDYQLPEYDAGVLVGDKAVADYYEATVAVCGNAKAASNWIMTEVLRVLSDSEQEVTALKVTPGALGKIIRLVDEKTINSTTAKELFNTILARGGDPEALVEEQGLAQVSDSGALAGFVAAALQENPQSVQAYREGKTNALQFLVGQVMRMSKGQANPQVVIQLLQEKLDG